MVKISKELATQFIGLDEAAATCAVLSNRIQRLLESLQEESEVRDHLVKAQEHIDAAGQHFGGHYYA